MGEASACLLPPLLLLPYLQFPASACPTDWATDHYLEPHRPGSLPLYSGRSRVQLGARAGSGWCGMASLPSVFFLAGAPGVAGPLMALLPMPSACHVLPMFLLTPHPQHPISTSWPLGSLPSAPVPSVLPWRVEPCYGPGQFASSCSCGLLDRSLPLCLLPVCKLGIG